MWCTLTFLSLLLVENSIASCHSRESLLLSIASGLARIPFSLLTSAHHLFLCFPVGSVVVRYARWKTSLNGLLSLEAKASISILSKRFRHLVLVVGALVTSLWQLDNWSSLRLGAHRASLVIGRWQSIGLDVLILMVAGWRELRVVNHTWLLQSLGAVA